MSEPRIKLKNPALATLLAWMVPGLGHAYQERWFKAVIYSVCIWSTFGCGWVLGDGKAVNFNMSLKGRRQRTVGFAAQVGVGLAALPAVIQGYRATPKDEFQFERDGIPLEKPLSGEFDGWLIEANYPGGRGNFKFRGQISIQPERDDVFSKGVSGKLTGTISKADEVETDIPDGTTVELTIDRLNSLEPEIYPSPHRQIILNVRGFIGGPSGTEITAVARGSILNVRSLWNRYAAPLDGDGLEQAHGDLGKFYEIGIVYTWIAGLLNVLAMWDAYEGPAYGYGDEESDPPGAPPKPPENPGPEGSGNASVAGDNKN